MPALSTASEAAPQVTVVEKRSFAPSKKDCETVVVFAEGEARGSLCVDDVAKEGLTVLDLADSWTPRVFMPDPQTKSAPEYRQKYLELAGSENADLGLNGIASNVSLTARRLLDDKRHTCNAAIERKPLVELAAATSSAANEKARAALLKQPQARDAIKVIQAELVCAGFLKSSQVSGVLTQATHSALETFRRRNLIVGSGLDQDTLAALALGGEELAFRALLRGVRERVAEAAGLIEDGTASETRELVVDRAIDLTRFAPLTEEALKNGAPDLVDRATDRAARELGWLTPESARSFLAAKSKQELAALRVAVALPSAPAYHSDAMELRVEVDRGDVFHGTPSEAALARRKAGNARPPSFVVYAKDGDKEVALIRWATTIGGWKKERQEDGEIGLKYKASDVGDRVWRQIIAAPAWMPPESTPETDLLHEDKEGNVALKRDLIQPGYRNAYGLVMLIHHEEVTRGGKTSYLDHGIRTHGSVDYRSIKRGTSHGCHRLYNQLALRLSGFLLDHRTSVRRGKMKTEYRRTLLWNEQTVEVEVPTRGYLFELNPPVPVRVLEGSISGDKQSPISMLPVDEPKKG